MQAIFHPAVSALAFFQSTQLGLFERFLTQAVSGIDSTNITSGMQTVAYVILLIGFLWQLYQSALHGGDVRTLGTSLIKYLATAVIIMNYHAVFTAINQGFVNAGNWVSSSSGGMNLLDNWANDLKTQYSQAGFQNLWGLVTGSVAGVLDAVLIIVAYILYPVVIAIFGFFYILYGSILYIFGPIVLALMPLGATNSLAKAYAQNVFIWNAWPVLYGGFGALLSAVQMGQVGQMLSQNNFLGGLGNLEGSILIGLASIIYSLAIAVIPFIAKKIVSGEVGATASTLVGTAAAVLTAGVAAAEGISAGVAAGSATSGTSAQGGVSGVSSASAIAPGSTTTNQPAAPQRIASTSQTSEQANGAPSTRGEHLASNIRGSFSDAFNSGSMARSGSAEGMATGGTAQEDKFSTSQSPETSAREVAPSKSDAQRSKSTSRRGPTTALMRPHGLATWGAYHAAMLATQGTIGGLRAARGFAGRTRSEEGEG